MGQVTVYSADNGPLPGSCLGTPLTQILNSEDALPGSDASYELAKLLYVYHPLGDKIARKPIELAQSQSREITIPDSPEEHVKKAFIDQWTADKVDEVISNLMTLARVYGLATVGVLTRGDNANTALDYKTLWEKEIAYNVWDPLNTAGSIVLNQDPNAMDFLKPQSVTVSGTAYHRSRTCVAMNEKPIYIQYTTSAYGYVGRSAYQRCLFPLKSFIQSMQTDDLVTLKAGVLVAKLKPAGSIVDNIMAYFAGQKRQLIREAQNYNVISINAPDEAIESLNLQNLDGASKNARDNILKNIAMGADMPALVLNEETFVDGFGEGTEDANKIARFVDRIRLQMSGVYAFHDNITQYRAWNPDFYAGLQNEFPAWRSVPFDVAFNRFRNSFAAVWPNFLQEPDSEKVKIEDVKLKAVIAIVEILTPALDPNNKAALFQWACDCFNENKLLFPSPLDLEFDDEFMAFAEESAAQLKEPEPSKPFAANDAQRMLSEAVARLPDRDPRRRRVADLVKLVNA